MTDGRARHLGRRAVLRSGIPPSVPIPKFATTDEIARIKRIKDENPGLTWSEVIELVLSNDPAAAKKEGANE